MGDRGLAGKDKRVYEEGEMKKREGKEESVLKKKWQKPKLIVLVKGRQDEVVLSACKSTLAGAYGPAYGYTAMCRREIPPIYACQFNCSTSSYS